MTLPFVFGTDCSTLFPRPSPDNLTLSHSASFTVYFNCTWLFSLWSLCHKMLVAWPGQGGAMSAVVKFYLVK